ncbi:MAG: hypothetical protein HQL91_09165 [Magnetococcales bacterium]|nr:hypothetical protein [Magnetococcales bacterium]
MERRRHRGGGNFRIRPGGCRGGGIVHDFFGRESRDMRSIRGWLLVFLVGLVLFPQAVVAGPDPEHRSLLATDGIHDPASRALGLLQDPARGEEGFPADRTGAINWAATLQRGLITPRTGITGSEPMKSLDSVIIMTNTRTMPHVTFPHGTHTQWLDCSNCHSEIFLPVAKGNPVTMNAILRGQYCGVCHGKVAFSPMVCERCHNVLHADSPKAWW